MNLMWGRGDVVAGGIDWWWVKQFFVVAMLGLALGYFLKSAKLGKTGGSVRVLAWATALFYGMYYIGMGSVMTWSFAWRMIVAGIVFAFVAHHLLNYHSGSSRAVFLMVGVFSFVTVILGGYVREASRPRFVNRISHYDNIYKPEQRQPYLMVDVDPESIPPDTVKPLPSTPVRLIRERCSGCHTLERVQNYRVKGHWEVIVKQMRAYGLKLSAAESDTIAGYLESGDPY